MRHVKEVLQTTNTPHSDRDVIVTADSDMLLLGNILVYISLGGGGAGVVVHLIIQHDTYIIQHLSF